LVRGEQRGKRLVANSVRVRVRVRARVRDICK